MRLLAAALFSAIILFFFGFLWWGVLMPILKPVGIISSNDLVTNMSEALPTSGLYMYPSYVEHDESHTGPMAILFYEKTAPFMPLMMGMGLGHMFVTALIASIFVSWLSPPTFTQRLGIVVLLGLFVAVWADVGNMIWWRHPIAWTAFHFAYDLLSWLIAGLVIAALVKPNGPQSPKRTQPL